MDQRCLSENLSEFAFCVYTFILFSVNVKAQETGNLVDVSVQPSYDTNAFISACTIEYLSDYVPLIEKINSKQITGTQNDTLTCRSFFFFGLLGSVSFSLGLKCFMFLSVTECVGRFSFERENSTKIVPSKITSCDSSFTDVRTEAAHHFRKINLEG